MIVESKFSPSWWLSNPHLQTILASKVFKPPQITTRRERIELDDKDFLDINLSQKSEGDIVAIFHGLAGCVESSYIQGVIGTLEAAGFRPVLMHWRGCSGEPNRLSRAYHSGASDDIRWFIDYLRKRFAGTHVYALGYSLGANALLKYLGETGASCPVRAAVAVCPPLVLSEGADKLDSGLARIYQRYLLALMRAQHERKRVRYPHLNLIKAGKELNSFWKFDDAITAPLHGYEGATDYYAKCSARQFLSSITVPAHILCARDDPFFTPRVLPDNSELTRDTTLEISATGGHVGFLGHESGHGRWLDSRVSTLMSEFRQSA
ncbi:MAG: hydrolase [Granulosicoccus sp.]